MSKRRKNPLFFTKLHLENWRNFTCVDADLQRRMFLVGPNASGKSNFLDVFRFLHDVASDRGDFMAAVGKPYRGGFDKLKSFMARHHADVGIRVCVGDDKNPQQWEYELRFAQEQSLPKIKKERVVKQGKALLDRPNKEDEKDLLRLMKTDLEQESMNEEFRELAEFFASVKYLHVVPQVLRNLIYASSSEDPFGGGLLRRIAEQPEEKRQERFALIRDALRAAVPQLETLEFWTEPGGNKPHLRAKFEHLQDKWQLEDQLSDGTLRLISLLWALLDGQGPLLLEEPELSLHPGIIRYLPYLFSGIQGRNGRQVMISTHSADLIREEGIGLNEVLVFQPSQEGTAVQLARDFGQVKVLIENGLSLDEAVMPSTAPRDALRLATVGTEQ